MSHFTNGSEHVENYFTRCIKKVNTGHASIYYFLKPSHYVSDVSIFTLKSTIQLPEITSI